MTNIKKILATTLSILVVTSGSMATNAMVAVPNVPHQPFMPPIVGVPTVNSGQLSFKSIKTQIANFFSFSSKTYSQLKNTENLYSDESEEIGGQWEDNDKIQLKFNPKNGTLTVTGTGAIPYMDGHKKPWVKKQINNDQVKTLVIGEGITEVGNCAFCIMTSLQKVYLPKSVTCLNIHAFFNCNSLEEMNFEDSSLTTIGMGALESNNFSKIKLPSSLTNLGHRAFAFNKNLKEVKFCGTASPVCDSNVFENCVNLTDVKVPEGYKSGQFCEKPVDRALNENCKIGGSCGENMLWELNDGTLNITGTGEMNSYGISGGPWKDYKDEITNVIIGDGVESIGIYAFNEYNKLAQVRFPEGLKSIGKKAFYNCPIKNLSIPTSVKHIDDEAFCGHVTEILEIPSCIELSKIGEYGSLAGSVKKFALKDCGDEEMPTLKVEDGVLYSVDGTELIAYPTAKEDRVFEIPELVKKIHSGAFRGCNNLKKLIIPEHNSLHIDADFTFHDASFDLFYCRDRGPSWAVSLEYDVDGNTNVTFYLSKNYPDKKDFCGSSAGKRVLNENCKIGDSCGENMLWELDYDGTLNITGTGEMNSYGIGDRPWEAHKDEITNVIIGDGIESIGSYAFEGCVNLQNVNISESVGQIGSGAFNNCMSPTNVNFNGLSDPGCSNAFEDCGKLESVNVPECYENNAFCGKNVSKILDHGSCTEPESSSLMESSQSSSKLSSSSISEVNLGSKRIELIFSKEDIQISSAEESIKDIIDLDPGQYKITVKVIDDEEVKITVQFVNEDDLNEFHKKVSECTK